MATAIPQAVETKTDLIRVRVTRQQRMEFARAATEAGLDLSSWLRTLAVSAIRKKRAK